MSYKFYLKFFYFLKQLQTFLFDVGLPLYVILNGGNQINVEPCGVSQARRRIMFLELNLKALKILYIIYCK